MIALPRNWRAHQREYLMKSLYNQIARAIAHPHNTVCDHDYDRAATIMMVMEDYLDKVLQMEDSCQWVNGFDLEFGGFVRAALSTNSFERSEKIYNHTITDK